MSFLRKINVSIQHYYLLVINIVRDLICAWPTTK